MPQSVWKSEDNLQDLGWVLWVRSDSSTFTHTAITGALYFPELDSHILG